MIHLAELQRRGQIMMGRQTVDQNQLFYLFNLEEHIPVKDRLHPSRPTQHLRRNWQRADFQ
jgi:hypothetical protein